MFGNELICQLNILSVKRVLALVLFSPLLILHSARAQDEIALGANQSFTDLQVDLQTRQYAKSDTTITRLIWEKMSFIDQALPNLLTCAKWTLGASDASLSIGLYKEIDNYKDLFALAENTHNLDSINNILAFIKEDMGLKFTGSLAAATAANPMVSVRVRVLNESNMKELPGYIAHVRPKWCVSSSQDLPFNPTNDAVRDIIPGEKIFWIEKDGRFVQQKSWRVSSFSESDKLVEFTVRIIN